MALAILTVVVPEGYGADAGKVFRITALFCVQMLSQYRSRLLQKTKSTLKKKHGLECGKAVSENRRTSEGAAELRAHDNVPMRHMWHIGQ